jgi:hypothetical protein
MPRMRTVFLAFLLLLLAFTVHSVSVVDTSSIINAQGIDEIPSVPDELIVKWQTDAPPVKHRFFVKSIPSQG